MCGHIGGYKEDIERLKNSFKIVDENSPWEKVEWKTKPVTIEEIQGIANYCPACTLSILRLSGMHLQIFFGFKWSYQSDKRAFWEDKNLSETRAEASLY
jgi:hypothetical protein